MFRFFVERPVFASVISLIIVIAGLAGFMQLPVSEYPEVAPPTVVINASYPGANPRTIATSVAAPIEEQLSGVEGLLYFQSTSSSDGSLQIVATFETGTNADQATINTNNRVQLALPRLPEEVRRNGVTVQKRSIDILMFVTLLSPKKTRDSIFLSNYATLNVVDELKRIPGVADVTIAAARDYSMRIWLQPDRMAQLGITPTDVANAIRVQNAQYATGILGQNPAPAGQALTYTVNVQGQLRDPQEFGNIMLRSSPTGGTLRLKDVARIELGARNYDLQSLADGRTATSMAVYLQTGANALQTSKAVRAKLDEMKTRYPEDVTSEIFFDTTIVVSESIREVAITLGISALLVVLVVFVFLQNWRATVIPMIAVPVSLIGTAAGLWLFGFSINQFSLFAMVLAIGIVVDDAIVVLENVERLMRTHGMSAKEAAIEAMREVASAVIAIVLVLCAVFIPVAFLGGIAGKLYQQFAVTIAVAVVISGLVALSLTPALCALLLRPSDHEHPFFHPFNVGFGKLSSIYNASVGWVLRHGAIAMAMFVGVIALVALFIKITPTGFVPPEDRNFVIMSVLLPDGASAERTRAVATRIVNDIMKEPGVSHVNTTIGNDFLGGGNKTNASTSFISLKPWSERPMSGAQYTDKFKKQFASVREANVLFFNPAPIRGIGNSSGFEVAIQSRADDDPKHLYAVLAQFIAELKKNPKFASANTFFSPASPQLYLDVDREKVMALGIPIGDVFDAIGSTIGMLYVNDFSKAGRIFRVELQADANFRSKPEDIGKVYVRSSSGAMIPLSAVTTLRYVTGPQLINRFNGFLTGGIIGATAPGVSSGEAIRIVEETAARLLPSGYTLAWSGQAFQEKRTGTAGVLAFVFGIVMVFLILAAQFERWSLPLAVILAVPFAVLGALIAITVRGMPNDVYFQIGLVVLVALASKNAILIVEFASQKQAEGMSVREAALEAAKLRFRPIVMTSLAFVLGVLPLVVASGAGSGARRSMGTGVFGGMIAATFIATAFIPLFYTWLTRERSARQPTSGNLPAPPKEAEE